MPTKKHLILTYGVSGGRQRTVVLSLPRVNTLLAAMAVMAVWSLGSIGYFVLDGFRTEAAAIATVAAAPQPIVGTAMDQAPQAAEPPAVPEAPKTIETVPAELAEKLEPVAVAQPVAEPVALAVAPQVEEKPALAATLEDYRAKETSGKLITRFSVRNLSQATLRGKVIAEAEFVAPDGSVKTVTSQQDYKARTLSQKQLYFTAPGPGKFTKVRITVNDQTTQRAIVFFK